MNDRDPSQAPSALRLDDATAAHHVEAVRGAIAAVPDFPKPGILFRDITPVLAQGPVLDRALALHLHTIADVAQDIDVIVGIESRGFLFGMPLAARLGVGFVPVRKPGKLPRPVVEETYALEYGADTLQMHDDALHKGQRVLVVDDLLATGGTATAACALVERLEATVVGCLFLIELRALAGRERLGDRRTDAIIEY